MRKKKSNFMVGLIMVISFLFAIYYIMETPL